MGEGSSTREFLEGAGDLGRDLLAVDWSRTPVGPPEAWSLSLSNAVRILLTSKFSMWMAWGPELTFFCNDAYRRDTLGTKYPWALGRPASEVWSEIWDAVGPRIDRVLATGEATWDEALMLFLERSGYVEETYHTFSYSPLADDAGAITGMLCVVSEETERMVSLRRMSTLRDLGIRVGHARTEAEAVAAACEHLAANGRSLPFALVYTFDEDGSRALLRGRAGIAADHPAAPASIAFGSADQVWPMDRIWSEDSVVVDV
ncbi:MAG: PAS domain-containing protein, partial [Actinobacteria bacterium]|nr:PAS domain-containing protein [Actinomycetota bacterium]